MKNTFKYILAILFVGFLIASCSDKSTTEPEKPEPKQLNLKTIEVPAGMQNANDAKASEANTYVSLVNGFTAYASFYQIPQTATGGNGKYTWSYGSMTATMFQEEKNGNITWKLILNGTDNGKTYSNWVAMEASQTTDGKNGWMKFYDDNSTEVASEWTWETDANGIYKAVMVSNSNGLTSKIEVTSNPDLSGQLLLYRNGVLTSKTTWDKNGNGQWWQYDGKGNIIASGSWTA